MGESNIIFMKSEQMNDKSSQITLDWYSKPSIQELLGFKKLKK